jgi:hypothetical protein
MCASVMEGNGIFDPWTECIERLGDYIRRHVIVLLKHVIKLPIIFTYFHNVSVEGQ